MHAHAPIQGQRNRIDANLCDSGVRYRPAFPRVRPVPTIERWVSTKTVWEGIGRVEVECLLGASAALPTDREGTSRGHRTSPETASCRWEQISQRDGVRCTCLRCPEHACRRTRVYGVVLP